MQRIKEGLGLFGWSKGVVLQKQLKRVVCNAVKNTAALDSVEPSVA